MWVPLIEMCDGALESREPSVPLTMKLTTLRWRESAKTKDWSLAGGVSRGKGAAPVGGQDLRPTLTL